MSPTTSSRTFSMVTMPTVPPNSSTTSARCACLPRNSLSNFSSGIISGTGIKSRLIFNRSGCGSRIIGSSSLICMRPTVLSRFSRHRGNRVCRDSIALFTLVSKSSSKSRYTISPRGVMISRTTRSRRSKTLKTSSRPSGVTSADFSLCSRINRNSSSLCASSLAGIG